MCKNPVVLLSEVVCVKGLPSSCRSELLLGEADLLQSPLGLVLVSSSKALSSSQAGTSTRTECVSRPCVSWQGPSRTSRAARGKLFVHHGFFLLSSLAAEALPVLPALLDSRGWCGGQLRAHAPQHLSLGARLRLLTRRLHPHEPQLGHLHLPSRQY